MDKELQRLKPFRRCVLTGPEGDARLKAKDVLNKVLEINGQARKDEQMDWLMGNSDPAEGYEEFGGMDASHSQMLSYTGHGKNPHGGKLCKKRPVSI